MTREDIEKLANIIESLSEFDVIGYTGGEFTPPNIHIDYETFVKLFPEHHKKRHSNKYMEHFIHLGSVRIFALEAAPIDETVVEVKG